MTDEQKAAFAALGDVVQECLRAVKRAWRAIKDAIAPIIRAVVRIYQQWRAAHLIPRQYRDTMMRRKIRRYVLGYSRR